MFLHCLYHVTALTQQNCNLKISRCLGDHSTRMTHSVKTRIKGTLGRVLVPEMIPVT